MWQAIAAGGLASLIGGLLQARLNRRQQSQNIAMQREFAQNGIRWRANDAIAAGFSPLVALGATGASYSPSQTVGGLGDAISGMGQNITRAAAAGRTRDEQEIAAAKLQLEILDQDLEHKKLLNMVETLRIQDLMNGNNPKLPSNSDMPLLTGQGDAYIRENPLTRTHSQPGRPGQEVGAISDIGLARTNTGYAVIPSNDITQRIEDKLIPEMRWAWKNQVLNNFTGYDIGKPDPRYYPPQSFFDEKARRPANDYRWSHVNQEWEAYYNPQYEPGYLGRPELHAPKLRPSRAIPLKGR